jgi:hypothetical protein
MRIFSLAAIAAILVGATLISGSALAAAQEDEQNVPAKKILGYQDPRTGAFHPLVNAVPDATLAPTTGSVDLTLTISLKTALPSGGKIICGSEISASSQNETTFAESIWIEEAYSVATVSGSTAKCTVNVPYSFLVPAASALVKNALTGSYTVEMVNAGTALPSVVVYLNGPFYNGSIPTTGATTNVAQNVTI